MDQVTDFQRQILKALPIPRSSVKNPLTETGGLAFFCLEKALRIKPTGRSGLSKALTNLENKGFLHRPSLIYCRLSDKGISWRKTLE